MKCSTSRVGLVVLSFGSICLKEEILVHAAPTIPPTQNPTPRPTPMPTMVETDTNAWKSLYDFTGGDYWIECSGTRDAPCTCGKVTCQGGNIVKINLQSNNLTGSTIPVNKFSDMTSLQVLRLGNVKDKGINNSFSAYSDQVCVDIPKCASGQIICTIPSETYFCNENPTPSPTNPPTPAALLFAEKQVWKGFYDTLGGDNWVLTKLPDVCDDIYNNPCDCYANTSLHVTCNPQGSLTDIVLRDNNMTGTINISSLVGFPNFERIVVSKASAYDNNVLNTPNGECAFAPMCNNGTWTCDVIGSGIELCSDVSPTPEPTTGSPTTPQPTREPTLEPTTSPTTAVPSASPSVSPTTSPTSSPTPPSVMISNLVLHIVDATFDPSVHGKPLFLQEMHQALVSSLSTNPGNVEILDVREGSIIVEAEIQSESSISKVVTGEPFQKNLRQNLPSELKNGRIELILDDSSMGLVPEGETQEEGRSNPLSMIAIIAIALSGTLVLIVAGFATVYYIKRRKMRGEHDPKYGPEVGNNSKFHYVETRQAVNDLQNPDAHSDAIASVA